MNEEPEDIGHDEKAVEKAFIESHAHSLDGLKLQPYSRARRMAAQAMKLHYGTLGDAAADEFEKTGNYPGIVHDICVVLWICSITDEREIDEAECNPRKARDNMRVFAEKYGLIDQIDPRFNEGYSVFLKIMNELAVSYVTAKKKTMTDSKKKKKGSRSPQALSPT